MSITQFTMEEVRCFGGRQTLEIRPLTFLVGENSTGKTTALACFHILADYLRNGELDFNSDPYSLGTFKAIVRNSKKKDKAFKIRFSYKHGNENVESLVEFVEKKGGVEPSISSLTLKFCDGSITLKTSDEPDRNPRLVHFNENQNQYQVECEDDLIFRLPSKVLIDFLEGKSAGKRAFAKYMQEHERAESVGYGLWDIWHTISVFSTSPIRSQPKRTYDPTREFYDPEGSDVPMLLMRIEATQKKEWKELKDHLVEFGKRSGLFQNIEIKNYGRSLGGPFQLRFKVRGPTCNIIDVGYGVSQILPILVHALNPHFSWQPPRPYTNAAFFLLQQPEVHLHPRAQAELSSLLANLANQGNRSFIIETHSDNMIDRARIDIMKGNINPDDVSLIYFEPVKNIVKVHNIGFDEMGNLIDAPTHYRDFFLKESKRLMGFKE